jgi:hypothetical protein
MSLLDTINNYDHKSIAFIKAGLGGYTMLFKNGEKKQGNDLITDEVINIIKKSGIPAIDLTKLDKSLIDLAAFELPMAAIYPDPPPYGSLSKAPIEVCGNLAMMIGANTYNIVKLDLPQEIFRKSTEKEMAMFKAFFANDSSAMLDTVLKKESLSILEMPSVDENGDLSDAVSLANYTLSEYYKINQESIHLLSKYENVPVNKRLKSKPGEGMDLFNQHLTKNAQTQAVLEVYGVVAYEAALQKNGNFSSDELASRIYGRLSEMANFHMDRPRHASYDHPLSFHSDACVDIYVKFANEASDRLSIRKSPDKDLIF